jgi:hypothetical protein
MPKTTSEAFAAEQQALRAQGKIDVVAGIRCPICDIVYGTVENGSLVEDEREQRVAELEQLTTAELADHLEADHTHVGRRWNREGV